MNNKLLVGLLIFLLFLLVGTFFLFTLDAYFKTIYTPKLTIEEVFEQDSIKIRLGTGNMKSPSDIGLKHQTVQFNSFDGIALYAWYIAAEDSSNKGIILSHDANSNRLETLKFLKAFKEAGLHKKFHLFIPDLRNAGASQKAPIFMGYKSAEDIATSITLLKERFNLDNIVLFGIGMGATASAIAAKRVDLQQHYQELDVEISALIMDSPVSHVGKTLTKMHQEIARPLASTVCFYFKNKTNGYLDFMRLHFLLEQTSYETLVLQNIGDETTPTPDLLEELRGISSVKLELFDGIEHGKIIQHLGYKHRYIQAIEHLLLRDAN